MVQAALHLIVGHRQAFTPRSDLICYAHAYHTIYLYIITDLFRMIALALCIVAMVILCVQFNSAKKTYGSPQHRKRLN